MTRVAAIDCGTNTIRLLVADLLPGPDGAPRLAPLVRENEIVRLGQGVDRTGRLDERALARTLAVVDDYATRLRALGAERVRFVATSATRDAENRAVFVDGVRERLGTEPEVVSGDEEARLSFCGALSGAHGTAQTTRLVVDLGGGSTELVLGTDAPAAACSMDTGSVRVTERYLADGVTPAAEAAARAHVRDLLDAAGRSVPVERATELVGLAGTITTITAHALGLRAFDPEALDGARLSVEDTLASCEAVLHSTPAERESWGYLRPGRRDVIAAGALVWSEVVARAVERTTAAGAPLTTTVTSLHDILDGIALSLAGRP
ncbi:MULTISPECIES: exopolyphosphatase [unclassified Actinomyces]|uniref:Ppx/GppA phosphatase family protein n=1 Tax=unclassified Actinomyces TaxID=2609248 RepID=UPI002017CF83|nr:MULTISPECIES: exopolyphosphatase [unclassified Actinomyces]MCL3776831.1 exopolyphosphatase [Actinomyces sp. AC-20-1]MCL3790688.1 exopolyphosphatase [Actinomyces sp. 187325]MCL3792794.1 exopolyphosphatase [Actinomyces sp. 186855]MCL3795463.1 exopolyphosphatase [Actinomyces sp. 217892]